MASVKWFVATIKARSETVALRDRCQAWPRHGLEDYAECGTVTAEFSEIVQADSSRGGCVTVLP